MSGQGGQGGQRGQGGQSRPPVDPSPTKIAEARRSAQSLAERSSSGVIWGAVDSLSQQILSMAIFVLLGRILSPALFGVVSTALVFVFLMRSTVLNAISTSLVTLQSAVDEDFDTGFWLLVSISLLAFIILNVAAHPLAALFKIDEFEDVFRGVSLIVLIYGLTFAHVGWARRHFMFKQLAIRNIVGVLVGGLIGVVLALAGHGLAALVINQVLAGLVSLFLLWFSVPWKPRMRFTTGRAKAIMNTAVPLGLTQSLQFAVQNFDTVLVTYLLGPYSGGLYAAGKRITLAIQIAIWQPISGVSLSAFSEIIEDCERLNRAIWKTGGLVVAVTAPVFTAVGATSSDLILLLFGQHWLPAAPVLATLSLFGIVVPSLCFLHQLVIAKGRAAVLLWFTLIQTAIAIGAVYLFGRASTTAIAFCLAAPNVVAYILTLMFLSRIMTFPMKAYLGAISRSILCAALMGGAMVLTPTYWESPLLMLVVRIVLGSFVYCGALFLFARPMWSEVIDLLMRVISRRLKPAIRS